MSASDANYYDHFEKLIEYLSNNTSITTLSLPCDRLYHLDHLKFELSSCLEKLRFEKGIISDDLVKAIVSQLEHQEKITSLKLRQIKLSDVAVDLFENFCKQ